jgi:hypothetical protein
MKKLRIADCGLRIGNHCRMTVRAGLIGLTLASFAILQAGCVTEVRSPAVQADVDRLVAEYNANAAAIPKVWARATIDLTVADDTGGTFNWGTQLGASNGILVAGKNPGVADFVLVGRESGQEVMRLGTSSADNVYYVWYHFGAKGGAWIGRADGAGAAGAAEAFVDPASLVGLLGIVELPSGSGQLSAYALCIGHPQALGQPKCDQPPHAYVLAIGPGGAGYKREIYFNWGKAGGPHRPYKVVYFGRDGKEVLTADLGDYQPVSGTDAQASQAVVPAQIVLNGKEGSGRKSHLRDMHLKLAGMKVGEVEPAEAAKFWDNLPPVLKERVVDVDKPDSAAPAPPSATAPAEERR